MKKSVLITGAARGIGRACALKFAREGYAVTAGYVRASEQAESLEREIRKMGGECLTVAADMRDRQAVHHMVQLAQAHFGTPDVLVCNAGIAQQKLFQDITDDDWRHMMGVNLDGVFYLTRAFLPAMIRQKAGRIINISSIWGVCGASCEVHYSASKAAVAGMTKALAKEIGPSGITVNCIAPGVIQTPMLACFSEEDLKELASQTPMGRLGTGDDVAQLALFLASGKADFITGQVICADGGFAL